MRIRLINATRCVLFCLLSVLTVESYSVADVNIVSDIDDTIKISNVGSLAGLIKNSIFKHNTFLGMSELYQKMIKNPSGISTRISYLSGSPQTLEPRLRNLLVSRNGFPEGSFYLNNWLNWTPNRTFKVEALKEMARTASDDYILIGDDVEFDPEAFIEFSEREKPGRILDVYIHQVTGRHLPRGVHPYVTAFDIALGEVERGRMTPTDARSVGISLLKSPNPELAFPPFVVCPAEYSFHHGGDQGDGLGPVASSDAGLAKVARLVKTYFSDYCKSLRRG